MRFREVGIVKFTRKGTKIFRGTELWCDLDNKQDALHCIINLRLSQVDTESSSKLLEVKERINEIQQQDTD